MQLQEYFDQLAPSWDKELTQERLNCLGNIVKELGIKPGYYVLDIGSGTGVLLPFLIAELGDEGKIIALDFSAEMLVQAQAKNFPPVVGFAQADVLNMPLPDNSACHTMSREMLNRFHQSIGGIVAGDLLPDESQLRGLIKQAGLTVTHFEDGPERYLVIAEKNIELQARG